MGAYKGQIHENFDVVSDLTTAEIVSKMHINIQMILTSIFFPLQSLQFTSLDLRRPGELGEICLISETQQQPWGQR